MNKFVGTGEKLVIDILQKIYPNALIRGQVKLSELIDVFPEWRQSKESLDIAVWLCGRREGKPDFVVKVNNKKGSMRMIHENRQDGELLEFGIKSANVNWYECTEVFNERMNYLAFFEVCDALRRADITP